MPVPFSSTFRTGSGRKKRGNAMPVSEADIALERKALMKLMDDEASAFRIPSRKLNENLILATWNIQHFSDRHSDRALQYIADICEHFDLIALQEVKTHLGGLQRLQAKLPGDYRILVSDPTGNSERFAFLYDKRTVIPTGMVCEIGFNVGSASHTGYQLHRMPYCASFRAGRFDFVVATAHIFFGRTKAERDQRRVEIEELASFIDRRARTERTKVFDRDFFVVGDFNIEAAGDEFFSALASKGFVFADAMNDIKTNFSRTRTYDKIVWVRRPSFCPTGRMNVVPFGDVVFREKAPNGAKGEISDHLPLWAEFEINRLTLELDQIINRGRD
jgi:endonuclease/exonuclease/phosphatase family metal-dependent hydrolase